MELLGMDIGGTKTAFRLVSSGGVVRESAVRWKSGGETGADLESLAKAVRELVGFRKVGRVGVAVPATLDARGRVLVWPNRPAWQGVDLRAHLSGVLRGAEVRFGDDGDLATLAEADQAGGRDLLYVGVGTGVGGGLYLGGRLLRSDNGPVAELGHVVVAPDGPRCGCGRQGCLQALASGPAVLGRAAQFEATDGTTLRSALSAGATWARQLLQEAAQALATAIVAVTELVRPQLVRLGGGFMAALPELAAATAAAVHALNRPGLPAPAVEPAAHGAMSSLAGAVLLAQHRELAAA
jgi:kanosamine 6-kinase